MQQLDPFWPLHSKFQVLRIVIPVALAALRREIQIKGVMVVQNKRIYVGETAWNLDLNAGWLQSWQWTWSDIAG